MVQLKKQYVRYIIAAVILAAAVLWVIRLNSITRTQLINRTGQSFETGVVVRILQDNIQEDGMRIGQQTVVVRMTSGEKKGEELTTTSSAGYLFGAACTVGMRVVVMQSIAGDSVITSVYSMDRKEVIIGFAVLYLGTLCVIGGKKGIRGALGLVFTFAAIIYVYLPLVYQGHSPFMSAVFICAVTAAVTLYLIGGAGKKTVCATAGTLAGVVIAGVAAAIFSRLSGITGWNVSDIESLLTLWQTNNIQVGGLLFSGLLISSLGAVMDVAMSISSSMQELCSQNQEISRLELMRAGMRVGRDMMGTDSNTLILAFAGTSLSMLVLDYAYELPYLQIINSNNIGIAVMQGLSGSFGVVLSVPATVLMAAYIYKGENG
ncbi:YibE/F family protein [Enterocloster clostridioformis]|uniref:YibE/F family protein n=1 Tax=Enterocloster clostridioformis TaxID=1531 RepID=UPI00080C4C60|nr:YibE/F family protein [Enterocloster clostridioformis]ANU50063.1 YibE/F family protein [Lachnoclostridium sp. YL32]NDO28444.1 YibE/F family protein [Enterocloster clostridioformis]OXE70872.1 YibE/F family protein [Enterocloster clostridioformis]QQR01036.1 YibE/F family protein [Enterocloster clostridioformis]